MNADYINLVVSIFAGMSAGAALWTALIMRQESRAQRAHEAWRSFLEISIANPKLSTENKKDLHEWYQELTIYTCDTLIRSDQKNYRELSKRYLEYVRNELDAWIKDKPLADLHAETKKLINEIMQDQNDSRKGAG